VVAVQGYADLAAGLEKVSEAKGAVDEAKGQVLQVCYRCKCELHVTAAADAIGCMPGAGTAQLTIA
jgi:hypothetical protein